MNETEVMEQLQAWGSEQTRKTYRRHGVAGDMYGVSYANLEKLRKKIKVDHDLAQKLWATGNHDARVLATMVADPARMNDRLLQAWAKDLSNYVLTDALSKLASGSPVARRKMGQWQKSNDEWIGAAGWNLVAHLAMKDEQLSDDYFETRLEIIERDVHSSKNRVRHAMMTALIAIGLRNGKLEKKAIAAAKKIGKVEVDHGETNCKTPDAVAYIQKAKQRKQARAR